MLNYFIIASTQRDGPPLLGGLSYSITHTFVTTRVCTCMYACAYAVQTNRFHIPENTASDVKKNIKFLQLILCVLRHNP